MSVACAVCGSSSRRLALRHPEGTLKRCAGCGLVSVDPLPAASAALAQYDAAYFRGAGYRDYEGEEAVFRAEFRRRLRAIRAAGGRGRILDVGAASGALMLEAMDHGFEVAGIEPAASMAARAAERTGASVFAGPIEAAAFPAGSFDVVTCFDALEHVVDPVAALARMRGWLVPEGLIAVTVPDFGSWWARLSGRWWPFVTPREHLHYFTRAPLAATLRAAGFATPTYRPAGTPISYGEIARETLGPLGRVVERMMGSRASRGSSIPFGCVFAIARFRVGA